MNPDFFQRVYEIVKRIPEGRVTTYGAIAKVIGSPQSSRMVGWALNGLKYDLGSIPAHRVVNRNGQLTGKMHFPFRDTMQQLLEAEGLCIEKDRVKNFEEYFWDPTNVI